MFKFLKEKQGFKGFSGVKGFFFSGVVGIVGNKKENENDIRWNFIKFVVDRKGEVVARFEPTTKISEVKEFENNYNSILLFEKLSNNIFHKYKYLQK